MVRRRMDADMAREHILSEARELFIEKGYVRATMEELRKRCGMSKGNLYYHFKTKEEMLVQVLIMHSKMVREDIRVRTIGIESNCEKLLAMAEIWGEDCKNPFIQYVDEFINDVSIGESILEPALKEHRYMEEMIKAIINDGVKRGELSNNDLEKTTNSILSMLEGTSLLCLGMPSMDVDDYSKIHRDNMEYLLNGLREAK